MEQPRSRCLIKAGPPALGLILRRIGLRRVAGEGLDGAVLDDHDTLRLLAVNDDRLHDLLAGRSCLGERGRGAYEGSRENRPKNKLPKHIPSNRGHYQRIFQFLM